MFSQRRKHIGLRVLAALGCALLLGVVGRPAVAAPDETPHQGRPPGAYAIFNEPGAGGRPDYRIQDHLVRMIERTPSGESIYGAMFTWTQTPVAQALADAQARGVHVRLAIDSQGSGGWNAKPENKAQQILQQANLDQLVYCAGPNESTSCIGATGGINHNKLFIFSRTGTLTDAVWVASYNLTKLQGLLFNNAVVQYGRPGLYQEFKAHMEHMLAQDKNNDYYDTPVGHYDTPDGVVSVRLSPRADSSGGTGIDPSTDTVAQILAKITTYEKGCRINVTHAQFTGPRRAVAEELIRIAGLGCQVRIAYGNNLTQYTFDLLHGQPNVSMRGFHDATDPDNVVSIHSKIIDIHANVGGRHKDMVLSGSQNITGPGLRKNDEILLISRQPRIARAFDQNFKTVWRRATCVNVPDDIVCNHDA